MIDISLLIAYEELQKNKNRECERGIQLELEVPQMRNPICDNDDNSKETNVVIVLNESDGDKVNNPSGIVISLV